MSNHALAEVMELSDRVVVIDARHACARDAAPRELIAMTAAKDLESAFVALARDRATEDCLMNVLAVYLKEMIDTLRDRRSLFSALSYGLFGPLAVVFTVNVLAAATRPTALEPVAVCSGDAPELVEHLTAAGLTFAPQAGICLHIPEDYAARVAAGATAEPSRARGSHGRVRHRRQAAQRDSTLRADAGRAARARARHRDGGAHADHRRRAEHECGLAARRRHRAAS